MALFFITGNSGKFKEVQAVLPQVKQLDLDLEEIQEIDPRAIIEHKLAQAQKHHPGDLIVEDISFYLDCLNGLPGPLIKWFLKTLGNDGLYHLSEKFNNPGASAKCLIGYSQKGKVRFFEADISGKIVAPRGDQGFGWDPIFQPDGFQKTFAEMSLEEKNQVSMRRLAVEKLKSSLD